MDRSDITLILALEVLESIGRYALLSDTASLSTGEGFR